MNVSYTSLLSSYVHVDSLPYIYVLLTTWAIYFVIPLSTSLFLLVLLLIVSFSFICWSEPNVIVARLICVRSTSSLASYNLFYTTLAASSPSQGLSVTLSACPRAPTFQPLTSSTSHVDDSKSKFKSEVSKLSRFGLNTKRYRKRHEHNEITTLHV